MLTFYEVICLEGKEKQGESDVPREGRKLGQVNKTPGLLFGYFIWRRMESSQIISYKHFFWDLEISILNTECMYEEICMKLFKRSCVLCGLQFTNPIQEKEKFVKDSDIHTNGTIFSYF